VWLNRRNEKIVHWQKSSVWFPQYGRRRDVADLAEDATAESATRMRPRIEQLGREIRFGAKLTRVRHQSVYVDSSKLLAKENEGLQATENLHEAFQDLRS